MRNRSTTPSTGAALAFAAVAHTFSHLFEPIFYIVAALSLPADLGLSYGRVLVLIVVAKVLYGVAAPAAGWLGDRWSRVGMMVVYFFGLGAGAIAAGLATGPWSLAAALALVGLFGSIYHPVGIAWLIQSAENRGRAIGINGVFGGLGPALAGLVTAGLGATGGWRAAFIAPGAVCLLVGFAFAVAIRLGRVVETKADRRPHPPPAPGEARRAGQVLAVTMLSAGLIYQATQAALPKVLAERLGDGGSGGGVVAVSMAVSVIYLVAGLAQIAAGHLADRHPPKRIYIGAALAQLPLLLAVAGLSGVGLVAAAALAVTANLSAIPAENLLVARAAPARWRGTAFGFKYVLGFGVASLAVPLVAVMGGSSGGLGALFALLAGLAALIAVAGRFLPGISRPAPVPVE